MQTRKKIIVSNDSPEHAKPRSCRQQRKVTVIAGRKVTELITSAKKQKYGEVHSKKVRDVEEARDLNTDYSLVEDEVHAIHMAYDPCIDNKKSDDRSAQCVLGTIFSPAFHHSKDVCGSFPNKVNFKDFFMSKDEAGHNDDVADESKADALDSCGTMDNQQNSTEKRLDITCTLACDKNADLMNISSATSDTQKNHDLRVGSNRADSSCDDEYSITGNLSAEVSAIYLAMQHSKLECLDEQSQDSISTEGYVEPDDNDEFDDFDPYSFIKDLPDLSAVAPKFRPVLLPKQTRSCPPFSLVLDLDETLVHSALEPCQDVDFTFPVNFNMKEHTIYVRCRPHLKDFMERVAGLFETIIFTASQSIYAERLLNVLDPKRKLFRHRVYRESCVYVEGNYLKDLSILGRDLARVIIVDNSPQAFGFQLDNGIPIKSWFDDRADQELLSLLPFLESLVGVDDVRPMIAKKFNLREKVAGAAYLPI